MDIRKVYEYALRREHEGKRFFAQNAGRLSHAAAVGVFEQLANEEQKHIEFIQAQIDALDDWASRIEHSIGKRALCSRRAGPFLYGRRVAGTQALEPAV